MPPWTKPAELASPIPIQRTRIERGLGGGLGRPCARSYAARGRRRRPSSRSPTEIPRCRRCPRLVEWREQVGGRSARSATAGEELLGAAGARRSATRRRGDRDRRPGAGRQRRQPDRADVHGRPLGRLALRGASPRRAREPADVGVVATTGCGCSDAWVTAVNRCAPPANKPTPAERDNCLPYLAGELRLLERARGCWWRWGRSPGTGRCARCGRWGSRCRARSRGSATAPRRRSGAYALVGCFHPSQQNTFTGKLTEGRCSTRVFARAASTSRSRRAAILAPWSRSTSPTCSRCCGSSRCR